MPLVKSIRLIQDYQDDILVTVNGEGGLEIEQDDHTFKIESENIADFQNAIREAITDG